MRLIDRMVNTQRLCHHLFSQFLEFAFEHQISFDSSESLHITFLVVFLGSCYFSLKESSALPLNQQHFILLLFLLKKAIARFFFCAVIHFTFRVWSVTEEVQNSFFSADCV